MKLLKVFFLSLVSVFVLVLVYLIATIIFPSSHGFLTTDYYIIIRYILLAVLTYLGILCHLLFYKLQNTKSEKIDVLPIVAGIFSTRSFWMALMISPIVLIGVFKGATDIPDDLSAYMFSFENGFFFKAILESASDNS